MFDITVKTTSHEPEYAFNINLLFPLSMFPLSEGTQQQRSREPAAALRLVSPSVLFPVPNKI